MLETIIISMVGFALGFFFACIFSSSSVKWDDYEAAMIEIKRLRSELASETAKKLYYKKAFEAKI